MGKKFFLIKSSITIMVFKIIGEVLGFLRELLIAAKYGCNDETDAYFIAMTAAGLFTTIAMTALTTTLIPVLAEVEGDLQKDGKIKFLSNILNISIVVSAILIVIGIIAAPAIVKILAYGFSGSQFDLTVRLTKIAMGAIVLKVIVGVFRGYLQSEERFFESAISDVSLNIVTVLFLFFFASVYGIKGLMVCSVLAVFTQLLAQIYGLKQSGYHYNFYINVKDKYIKKIALLIPPIIIGTVVNDINLIVDKTLASALAAGSISALSYSGKLQGIVVNVIIASIVAVIFPTISKLAANNEISKVRDITSRIFNVITILVIPLTLIMICFATPIVNMAFQRGEYTFEATQMTAYSLRFYAIGTLPMSLRLCYNNVYYAVKDTKTPMINGFITVALNVVLSMLLVRLLDHGGIALATSIASLITTILLIYGLRKKIGSIIVKQNGVIFLKTSFSSAIACGIAFYLYSLLLQHFRIGFMSILIIFVTSLTIGGIIYCILMYFMKVKEFELIYNFFKKKCTHK